MSGLMKIVTAVLGKRVMCPNCGLKHKTVGDIPVYYCKRCNNIHRG